MPNYTLHGKLQNILSLEEFSEETHKIKNRKHKIFSILLFYTGVRVTEMIRPHKEDFSFTTERMTWDVGPREKTGHVTAPLTLPLNLEFMNEVAEYIKHLRRGRPVFGFTRATGWRIITRYYGVYPHYFRLNRITSFLRQGFSVVEVMSWSGHRSIAGITPYVGQVDIERMGLSLGDQRSKRDREMGAVRR